MEKKAIKGFLVDYNGDECYKVYIPNCHRVICSRDVQFVENPRECESENEVPVKDIGSKNCNEVDEPQVQDKEEDSDEPQMDIEERSDINKGDNLQNISERVVRDRSTLKRPKYLEPYAMIMFLGIVYNRKSVKAGFLEIYDANFGGCTKSRGSTSGVVKYSGGAVSWLSQRQAVVATSTTEAEIIAVNEGAKEAIWLSRLFSEIRKLIDVPVIQFDNTAAVSLAQKPEFHRRTKHISIKHFFICEKVTEGKLCIQQKNINGKSVSRHNDETVA